MTQIRHLTRLQTNLFIAIQALSVPCERLFSSAGLVDTKHRNRLGAGRFGSLEYIKAYFKHLCHNEDLLNHTELSQKNTLIALDIANKHINIQGD